MKIELTSNYIYKQEMKLVAHVYRGDRPGEAIKLMGIDVVTGEPIMTFTEYVQDQSESLKKNELLLKIYSENLGVGDAMVKAGLGKLKRGDIDMNVQVLEVTNPELLALMEKTRELVKIETNHDAVEVSGLISQEKTCPRFVRPSNKVENLLEQAEHEKKPEVAEAELKPAEDKMEM